MSKYLLRILLVSFGSLVGTSFGFERIELVELRLFFFLQFPISSLIPFSSLTHITYLEIKETWVVVRFT